MSRESIVIFRGQLEAIMELTSLKDVKSVVTAIIEYGMNGNSVDIPEHLRFGWKCIQYQIDQVNSHYEEVREKRSAAAKKSHANASKSHANASKSMQMQQMQQMQQMHANAANACNNKNKNDNDNVSPEGDGIITQTPGYPASVDEVLEIASQPQCGARISREDAERYFVTRMSTDWVDAAGRKIAPEGIIWDLKKWEMSKNERRGSPKNSSTVDYSDPSTWGDL